jgi:hypothetical protein
MSAGTKRSNADEDNNDETPTNANTGIVISEPVKKATTIYRSIFFRACDFTIFHKTNNF